VPRHPDQFYELIGDLLIAAILLKLRPRLPQGATFLLYLVLFSALRFVLFFVRGNVPVVALGLKNAQWTSLAILAVAAPLLMMRLRPVSRVPGVP
jgi:phosphatidylglycerol:prolipoprotein diacylglycerol transferase